MTDDPDQHWPIGDGEMAARVREHDWAATPIGPIARWPVELRALVELLLAQPGPVMLLWGADLVRIYNDGCRAVMAAAHPAAFGRPARDGGPDAGDIDTIRARVGRGEMVTLPDRCLAIRDGEPEGARFTLGYGPVRDAAGEVAGVFVTAFETGARMRTEAAHHRAPLDGAERLTFLLTLSDALRPITDPIRIQSVAARLVAAHFGTLRAGYGEVHGDEVVVCADHAEGAPSIIGRHPIDAFGPAIADIYRHGGVAMLRDARTEPGLSDGERERLRAMGIAAHVTVAIHKEDQPVMTFGVHGHAPRDWTAADIALIREIADRTWAAVTRARGEAARRESEERLRQFGEASQDVLWIRDAQTLQWRYLTPAFEHIYGLSRDEALAGDNLATWLDLILPDDRDRAMTSLERVRAGDHVTFEFRIRRPRDGAVRWLRNTDFPILGEDGRVVMIGGIGHDATDLKRLEQRQATLLAELQHRVRNILAVTRSIITRTEDGDRSIEDYTQHLQGRIDAMARTQVLLTRTAGTFVDLDSLIRDELLAQVASFDRVTLTGEDVALSPKNAEVLTLALHELATNATKYGAFSRPAGRLEVRWRVDDRDGQDWLIFDWIERGVPIVDAAPRRSGFGEELISRRIPYELKGHGSLELKAGGLASHIEFPLTQGDSILQTDAGVR